MTPAPDPSTAASHALQRWQRVGLRVRLGFNTGKPCAIGCYIGVGRRLARHGLMTELEAEQRMYRLLLQTATDLALPWAWRQHCLSHAVHPLARLTTLLAGEPFTVTALHARWELAYQQLPAAPAQALKDEG